MQQMVQSLLEDRFQLKVYREMREVPMYNLVVGKEGKLKQSSDPPAPDLPPMPQGRIRTFVLGQPNPSAC